MIEVIHGNNIEILKQYPDNYFDSVVTDPPYGLGKEPDSLEVMKDWIEKDCHEIKGVGFMGKEWDAFVPQPIFWKEVFRVLKNGGHVLSFFGTRTFDWGVMAMRFAGFEIRDTIYWHYGSGFPKSHNISKAIDAMMGATESATEDAKNWEGWGTALKPATEPIVMARKPLEKGLTIAENILKFGTGGINIDACRVKTSDDLAKNYQSIRKSDNEMGERGYKMGFRQNKDSIAEATESTSLGRFPANLILSHHEDCEYKGTKKIKGSSCSPSDVGKEKDGKSTNGIYGEKENKITVSHTDEDGFEEVEEYDCHPDCPIKIMDEQSGTTKNGKVKSSMNQHGDSGGASRFFYVAKASKSERNKGLQGEKNIHPTVKPIKLMQYLVRLVTPPNGVVLDPYCGSGTTGIACTLEGFNFVGIEQDAEYCKIAESRIVNFVEKQEDAPTETKPPSIQTSLF